MTATRSTYRRLTHTDFDTDAVLSELEAEIRTAWRLMQKWRLLNYRNGVSHQAAILRTLLRIRRAGMA